MAAQGATLPYWQQNIEPTPIGPERPKAQTTGGGAGGQAGAGAVGVPNVTPQMAAWIKIAQQQGVDPRRVVEVYMNPSDPHAKADPMQALGDAMADDAWARAATNAFGRPPNELEWQEHYYAKNYGSRDPLEGHPEAIQQLINEANQMGQGQVPGAQSTAQEDLRKAGLA